VRSVVDQKYEHIEYIVVDGASADETLEIINNYRDRIAVFISEPDNGIYSAMNKGIVCATGDLVFFLNADDYFVDARVIADVIDFVERHPKGDVYYGSIEVRLEDGTKVIYKPDAPDKAPEIMICGCLPHQATFARRRVFERTGPFDQTYRYHADYDWFLKIIADPEIELVQFNRVVASFRLGGVSSQLANGQPEAYRIQNASPLYQSEEWSRRRIAIFQQSLVAARIENDNLKAELRRLAAAGRRAELATRGITKPIVIFETAIKRFLPTSVTQVLRSMSRRVKTRLKV
jgi:glycosyltransferase involved in cell wall biosynthesis